MWTNPFFRKNEVNRPQLGSRRWPVASPALVLTFLFMGTPATRAQEGPVAQPEMNDSRWSPWVGCWELSEESVDRSEQELGGFVSVCLAPTPDGQGVKITTVADDKVILEEEFFADGVKRDVEEPGCRGWQSAEWSGDGDRLFLFSDATCAGVRRSISGVSFLVSGGEWVDIQSIATGARRELVVRRYLPSGGEPSAASRRLSIEDVVEAAGKIDTQAVEALLFESGAHFYIDSATLLGLADSHLPVQLIDLMVALSFPERFQIDRRGVAAVKRPVASGSADADYAPLTNDYDPYGYWYPFYYAPFGYYSYWYSTYPGYYLLTPDPTSPESGGRVVKNEGYTRVSPQEAHPRGSGGGGDSQGSDSSSSGSSSVGQSGYRSGGASGRTAKPKNE